MQYDDEYRGRFSGAWGGLCRDRGDPHTRRKRDKIWLVFAVDAFHHRCNLLGVHGVNVFRLNIALHFIPKQTLSPVLSLSDPLNFYERSEDLA